MPIRATVASESDEPSRSEGQENISDLVDDAEVDSEADAAALREAAVVSAKIRNGARRGFAGKSMLIESEAEVKSSAEESDTEEDPSEEDEGAVDELDTAEEKEEAVRKLKRGLKDVKAAEKSLNSLLAALKSKVRAGEDSMETSEDVCAKAGSTMRSNNRKRYRKGA